MIRMLIVGYAFAVRSERALCREVQVNLAYRWFCGLSIEGARAVKATTPARVATAINKEVSRFIVMPPVRRAAPNVVATLTSSPPIVTYRRVTD